MKTPKIMMTLIAVVSIFFITENSPKAQAIQLQCATLAKKHLSGQWTGENGKVIGFRYIKTKNGTAEFEMTINKELHALRLYVDDEYDDCWGQFKKGNSYSAVLDMNKQGILLEEYSNIEGQKSILITISQNQPEMDETGAIDYWQYFGDFPSVLYTSGKPSSK